VTVDVGKIKNVGNARCPNGDELPEFNFFNTGEGYKYFLSEVEKFKEMHKLWESIPLGKDILGGIESTGVYGEPLIHFLCKRKIKVVQVNPMHTKRVKEIRGNSPNKTDEKDPKVIADIPMNRDWAMPLA
jgi:transposase